MSRHCDDHRRRLLPQVVAVDLLHLLLCQQHCWLCLHEVDLILVLPERTLKSVWRRASTLASRWGQPHTFHSCVGASREWCVAYRFCRSPEAPSLVVRRSHMRCRSGCPGRPAPCTYSRHTPSNLLQPIAGYRVRNDSCQVYNGYYTQVCCMLAGGILGT